MNTNTEAAEAAHITAARDALRETEARENEAARAMRETGNRYELAKQGAFLIPEEERHELREREAAYEKALADHEAAKIQTKIARAALNDALLHPEGPPVFPLAVCSGDPMADLSVAVEAMKAARDSYTRAVHARELIDAELAGIEQEREHALGGKQNLEKQAQALSVIISKRAIVEGRIAGADADIESALALYAAAVRAVQGELNPLTKTALDTAKAAAGDFRKMFDQLPVYRLMATLSNAQGSVGHAHGPAHFVGTGERFLAAWEALKPALEDQESALAEIAAGVKRRIDELNTAAEKALASLEGGTQ